METNFDLYHPRPFFLYNPTWDKEAIHKIYPILAVQTSYDFLDGYNQNWTKIVNKLGRL